jgi:NADH dehydrogenase [ubiquinone] 1 alpha subcomplex assembly factor 1
LAAGGWKGGADSGEGGRDVHVDEEMEALMRSDLPAGAELPGRVKRPEQVKGGGAYHRVGSASLPREVAEEAVPQSVQDVPEEGYYELCIESVEAVRWDPEAEDGPAE